MAIFIDPPRWPAHGTVFSHVVSDTSYEELHDFATRLGLSQRAFDEDHYDVPCDLYHLAILQGARPVTGGELIRILIRSGLRVPAVERTDRIIPLLRQRWADLWPTDRALGEELLARWSEPHRSYHSPVHLYECLSRIEFLTAHPPPELLLAAWFHDAIYEGVAGEDEEQSAELAKDRLGGKLGAEVFRLVRLTRDHRPDPGDHTGAILVDADLGVLAAPKRRYQRYVTQVRAEYSHVSPEAWRAGRQAVLDGFLHRPAIYFTPVARHQWERGARRNLSEEIVSLSVGKYPAV